MQKKILGYINYISSTILLLVLFTPSAWAESLENPLGTTEPNVVIANVIRTSLGVVGSIALLMFVYGGITLLISSGNPEKVQKGRQTLTWATLGLIFILGSYGIVQTVIKIILGQDLV